MDRTRILSGALNAQESQFAYLAGGPGFGKTTLLKQAAGAIAREGVTTVLYELSGNDSDPKAFIANLREVFRAVGISVRGLGEANSSVPAANAGAASSPFALLLDDYHRGGTPAHDEFLARFFSLAPAGTRVIVAGRSRPSLALLRLKQTGQFTIAENSVLRFSSAEICALLQEHTLHDKLLALLNEAQGWPVAVDAIRACRYVEEPDILELPAVRVRDYLRSYLKEHVAGELPAYQWNFIEHVCLGPTFSVASAQHMLPGCDARRVIHELLEANILSHVDRSGLEFQFESLFRTMVADALRRTLPDHHDALVTKAAAWHIASGNWPQVRAVSALAINPSVGHEILEQAGGWILAICRGNRVFDRMLFEGLNVQAHPRLAIAKSMDMARSGLTNEARALFECIRSTSFPSFKQEVWQVELIITDAWLNVFADKTPDEHTIQRLEAVLEANLDDKPVLYAIAASFLCQGHYLLGNYNRSLAVGLRAIDLCDHYGAPYAASYCYAFAAMSEFRLGNLVRAREMLVRMQEHVKRFFDEGSSLNDVAAVLLACVVYEEGKLDEADLLLDRSLEDVVRHEGLLEVAAGGFVTASLIATQRREFDHALFILRAAGNVGARRGFLRLSQIAQCRAMYLLSMVGRLTEAENIASGDEFPDDADARLHHPWRDYISISLLVAQAGWLLANGRFVEALERLNAYLEEPHSRQNSPSFTRVICLKLVAAVECGESAQDIAAIIRTMYLYIETKGFVSALMETILLLPILERCAKCDALPLDARQLATRLQGRLRKSPLASGERPALIALSPRQRQILALLKDGLSNKEISVQLAIAEGTVKSYRKVLYQKLGISRRSQAVARAGQLA